MGCPNAPRVLTLALFFGESPQAVAYSPHPPLTEEQYGKLESKYHEAGHCQSAKRLRGVFNAPLIFNNSVETAAPFNVVSQPRCCEPKKNSLEKFRPLAGIKPANLGTKCRVFQCMNIWHVRWRKPC